MTELELGRCCYEYKFFALCAAVTKCCDAEFATFVMSVGEVALITRPQEHKEKWLDKSDEQRRRGRKPQAYQWRLDEAQDIHISHKSSKCWKDQSKRRHQWHQWN